MSLARILLPVFSHPDFGSIAATAFTIAGDQRAMIEGLYAYTAPGKQVHLYYEAAAPEVMDQLLKDAERRCQDAANTAKETFDRFAAEHSAVSTSFVTTDFGLQDGVASRGRLCDLTVVGVPPEGDEYPWPVIRDAALFRTGRPVLIVPKGQDSAAFARTVVIGWKDSVEAARAVQTARPFLAKAKSIRLVSAGHDAVSQGELDELKDYMSLSFKNVAAEVVASGKNDSAALLLREVSREPGSLLVMGAYSRWKWSEAIFGGVTDYILNNATVPVLMMH